MLPNCDGRLYTDTVQVLLNRILFFSEISQFPFFQFLPRKSSYNTFLKKGGFESFKVFEHDQNPAFQFRNKVPKKRKPNPQTGKLIGWQKVTQNNPEKRVSRNCEKTSEKKKRSDEILLTGFFKRVLTIRKSFPKKMLAGFFSSKFTNKFSKKNLRPT